MQNTGRVLYLDICDYSKKKICTLYNSDAKSSGQATDVFITTERNGWKELSFSLPCVIESENGSEPNFRLDYLKADYQIRAIDDTETDWFIISEPKITHNGFLKTMNIVAGHVSQLLKGKNLDLEFSDNEGNNIGTAEELATAILNGTGWTVGYVYPFAEKDGTTKYRSLKASAKTGAFKLLTMMCDLFDAKPIFHGDSRTVDIAPINPFSEPVPGAVPTIPDGSDVIELHYGKNIKNVTRALNTDNLVTQLYAYGSYGDKTSGYCGIDECTHLEYEMILTQECEQNKTYFFTVNDDAGVAITYHFTPHISVAAGSKLIFSLLDPASMLYVWDDNNQNAYPASKGTVGLAIPANISNLKAKNWFQFVMNFDYYRKNGLLNDDMIQAIAAYQRTTPAKYEAASEASLRMSDAQTVLSKTIGVIDFCKLDIDRYAAPFDGYITLFLNKDTYKDGVIYRSDYDKSKDNYFKWRKTESLNVDGDPINSAAGVVYIIHNTNPVTWDKAYIKDIDNEDDPSALTLWTTENAIDIDVSNDSFFLFSYNGINGHLGTLESNDESAVMSLAEAVRVVTVDHPVIFTTESPEIMSIGGVNGYGWLWRYYNDVGTFRNLKSEMYFTYPDDGDTQWNYVYFTDKTPSGSEVNSYWYDWRNAVLYRRKNNAWNAMDTAAQQKIASLFATVYMFGKARDRYYQGLYQHYTYTASGALPAGNYFIRNEFDSYWAFTTTEALNVGDTLDYDYENAWVTQTKKGVQTTLKPKGYRFDNVNYHSSNILKSKLLEDGAINISTGELSDSETNCRSQSHIAVVPSTTYNVTKLARSIYVHFYNDKKQWISSVTVSSSFTTPGDCTFIRISADVSSAKFSEYTSVIITAHNSDNIIVIEDLNYALLPTVASGEIIGLVQCIDKFLEYADLTYGTYYNELKAAQAVIDESKNRMTTTVGDLLREGWWHDTSYVDGDEDKLRDDALDNLKQISKPEATYTITYLDTFDSNIDNKDYGASQETSDVRWPDLSISSAAHLVDPEIDVNTWAFMDKIQKCYDKPWQTKIAINTNLSTIAQHSFSDVMSNIVTVASEMKGKTSYYDKTLDSIVSNNNSAELQAGLVRSEKELLSAYERIDQINGAVIKSSSIIKQAADEISSEVSRATTAEGVLSKQLSLVKQTADGFSGRIESAETNASTAKTQVATFEATVSGFDARIKSAEENATSSKTQVAEFKATVSGFDARIQSAEESAESSKTQVAAFEATVSGYNAKFTTMETQVGNAVSAANSAKQTANSAVNTANNAAQNAVNSVTTQIADYKAAVDGYSAQISAAVSTANAVSGEVNTIKNTSIFSATADTIRAIVKGETSNGGDASKNEFKTSSVSIDKNGVAISTSGTFTVDSGNFEVDENGRVSVHDAFISGDIYHKGYPVLTNQNIVYGKAQPANPFEGMIWLQPYTPSSSGGSSGSTPPPAPTGVEVVYEATCSQLGWTSRDYIGTNYNSKSKTGTLYGSGRSASSTNCTYNVSIPLYLGTGASQNTTVLCRLTGSNGQQVELSGTVYGTGACIVQMSRTVNTWIGTGSTINFTICTNGTGTYTNVLNSRAGGEIFKVTCKSTT